MKPFQRLYTNPKPSAHEIGTVEANVRAYLNQVLVGDGARAHCPFVALIESKNGYWWKDFSTCAAFVDFGLVAEEMLRAFRLIIANRPAEIGQKVETTTVIAAFSDQSALSPEFHQRLVQAHDLLRPGFIQHELMVGYMTPHHTLDGPGQRFVSKIPLLIVRQMHARDAVFMKTEAELAAHRRFFPEKI